MTKSAREAAAAAAAGAAKCRVSGMPAATRSACDLNASVCAKEKTLLLIQYTKTPCRQSLVNTIA